MSKPATPLMPTSLAHPLRWRVADIEHRLSDLKQVTEALCQREERYHDLLNNLMIGVYRMAPDGEIITANQVLVNMLGFESLEELKLSSMSGQHPAYLRTKIKAAGNGSSS